MEALLNKILAEAIDLFFVEDLNSILDDVNERNLCGRLTIYLNDKVRENDIIGYYVDPEYNRMQDGRVKTILDEEYVVSNINCDLILHSRGGIIAQDNLLAIEMKKSNRPEEDKNNDRKRLRALTKESYDDIWSADGVTLPEHVCGYIFGIYMELNIGRRTCLFEYYRNGNKAAEWNQTF
ncbi:MAG: hypothetical protein Q8L90_03360 [Bacteroidota bacterium]|nr:hypothetical protein [Bacteroidota bacterium]